MLTVLLEWAAFAAAILAAWLFLGFLTITTLHLAAQAAKRRRYRAALRAAITAVTWLRCGCLVVEDASGATTFPCAADEAIAEVEEMQK